jgi:Rps23 Pro-64 3,4-dihydroxylase Tpa1-like proline 4-hydroxylase
MDGKSSAPSSAAGPAEYGAPTSPFALNPDLDAEALRRQFAATGRVHIPHFLEPGGAAQLADHLRMRSDWLLVINQQDKIFELGRDAQKALTDTQQAQLDSAIFQAARHGFQYRYETLRVPDGTRERAADPSLLNRFAEFLSSGEVLAFLRRITGSPAIRFADAQATAYAPGHFLTAHDDDVAGKNRIAAYVMNLSPDRRIDWGGLLMFEGADGHVEQAFVPTFNALNLFAVPARHSVSYVAPFAPRRRYSVTGWLRAIEPPA